MPKFWISYTIISSQCSALPLLRLFMATLTWSNLNGEDKLLVSRYGCFSIINLSFFCCFSHFLLAKGLFHCAWRSTNCWFWFSRYLCVWLVAMRSDSFLPYRCPPRFLSIDHFQILRRQRRGLGPISLFFRWKGPFRSAGCTILKVFLSLSIIRHPPGIVRHEPF